MEDILSALDEVQVEPKKTTTKKAKGKTKSAQVKPTQDAILGRVDYDNLKKVIKTTELFAVRNVGELDLITDWDLDLMPVDMQGDFDEYLSHSYNMYQVKESNLTFRIVVIYRDGKSVNFLHQFMTSKKVPNLELISIGAEAVIMSQFVLPAGATMICTSKQYNSLKRFEKRRVETEKGDSDWQGHLVFKQLDANTLKKVQYSSVTLADLKNNGFTVEKASLKKKRGLSTMEYDDFSLDE